MARVLLGVTGGIAAYKACELTRLLVRAGHEVIPLVTRGADRFVRRETFAALARPDMALHEELGEPWPGITDRLDRALDAVENLRDLLLGTFEIYMGRTAQDANDTMKVLTLLSAVLLPGVVLAGVMGMNFQVGLFDEAKLFWAVVAVIVLSVELSLDPDFKRCWT